MEKKSQGGFIVLIIIIIIVVIGVFFLYFYNPQSSKATINITAAPTSANVNQPFTISWVVMKSSGTITSSSISYGNISTPDTSPLYPIESENQCNGTCNFYLFTTQLTINQPGIYYYRAHAVIDDLNLWSDEYTIQIIPENQSIINYPKYGFNNIDTSINIVPNQDETLNSASYHVGIPQGTFDTAVKFDILRGNPLSFSTKVPENEIPILAFAFKATDLSTNELIPNFNSPINVNITSSLITDQSNFYLINPDGSLKQLTSNVLDLEQSRMMVLISKSSGAWLITKPK
jgi:hypothetical protein